MSVSADQTNLLRYEQLNYKVQEHRVEEVWNRFIKAGFKPLLIKGWAAAQYYSRPSERRFNDVDLAFAPEEFNRAEMFLEVFKQENQKNKTAIDLHRGLRQLDTLTFEDLYAHSQTAQCGRAEIRVLCPEDHLRVLCVHWLIDGGAKKSKLRDVYYAVKNRRADFDWERCLNVVSRTRRNWILVTLALAQKYLDLDVSNTPLTEEAVKIPRWLVKALEKEWQSDALLLPLHQHLSDRKELWRQIKKRVPPNPIQATINMEGEFDDRPRIFYQAGDIIFRLQPSVRRILNRLFFNSPKF